MISTWGKGRLLMSMGFFTIWNKDIFINVLRVVYRLDQLIIECWSLHGRLEEFIDSMAKRKFCLGRP